MGYTVDLDGLGSLELNAGEAITRLVNELDLLGAFDAYLLERRYPDSTRSTYRSVVRHFLDFVGTAEEPTEDVAA